MGINAFHGKQTDIYLGIYDRTSKFKNLSLGQTAEEAESTAFGDTAKQFLRGQREGTLSMDGYFEAAATTGIDDQLNSILGAASATPLTVFPQGDGTITNAAYLVNLKELNYEIMSSIADVIGVKIEGRADGGLDKGYVLHAFGIETGGGVGYLGVNTGHTAAGSYHYFGHVHATILTGTNVIFNLEYSLNSTNGTDGAWVALAAFTAASAATGQRVSGTLAGVTPAPNLYIRGLIGSATVLTTTSFVMAGGFRAV